MTRSTLRAGLLLLAATLTARAADTKPVAEAERLAEAAIQLSASKPSEALAQARRALELTADFEPTAFVKAGRKGEVVEDTYIEARDAYRRHRARLYRSVGRCLAASGRHAEAVRYLRRAVDLSPGAAQALDLARSLVALERGREALAVLLGLADPRGAEALALAGQAADATGLPSLQVELDRVRLQALEPSQRPGLRDGPFRLPERTRLSSGVVADLEQDGLTLLYSADASCRTCSADLETIKRTAGPAARVLTSAPGPEQDRPLRLALSLYHYDWPLIVPAGAAKGLELEAPSLLVIARRGLLGALLKPPLLGLAAVLDLLARTDVAETLPRPQWRRRPVDRRPPAAHPTLLAEGLAPGEDDAAPAPFTAALEAYRAGKFQEAMRLFDEVERAGDGFLLPPEARLNRGLCLIGLGRREAARLLLLKTGDSRFQEDVDRALERAGSPSKNSSSTLPLARRAD